MENPVYLDYNATTPIDPEVAKEMIPFVETYFGNPSCSYLIGRQNKDAIEKARKQVAVLINCNPEEIIFTSGGTESNNHAIKGVALANWHKGKHIIASAIEHPAVTEVCEFMKTNGYDISYVKVDEFGQVNPADVEKAIRPDTIIISVMHANNEVGTIQPIKKIADIAKKNHIILHTDAVQAAGKIKIDVQELGIDLLSVAGHKLYAPKGIGVLYIKKGTQISNLLHGAGQEKGRRPGTENIIGIVGLGKACEIASKNLSDNNKHMKEMRERLYQGLKKASNINIKVNGHPENRLPNTLSISFEKVDSHTLASLIKNDVLISTGSACHSGIEDISPVLKAMNVDLMTAGSTVRISTGKYTTRKEIDFAVEVISKTVLKLSH